MWTKQLSVNKKSPQGAFNLWFVNIYSTTCVSTKTGSYLLSDTFLNQILSSAIMLRSSAFPELSVCVQHRGDI